MGNGNRSGGPKTPVGKAASSKNALKLGVYSKQQFLPGEKPEDFENLKLRFSECLKPIGLVGLTLVHEITLLAWKEINTLLIFYRILFYNTKMCRKSSAIRKTITSIASSGGQSGSIS